MKIASRIAALIAIAAATGAHIAAPVEPVARTPDPTNQSPYPPLRTKPSRLPHQGKREAARRLKQMAKRST